MSRLAVTLACGAYDRTRALCDGRVPVEGVDLRYIALEPEETFFRMARHREFDVSELSLSTYLVTLAGGGPDVGPFVAIPVFPSRMFRHSSVYVNVAAGIRRPSDLEGRRVGVAEYQLTANVWVRGMLEEYYGVAAGAVRYHTGGLNQPGRTEKVALELPGDIEVEAIPQGATLSEMLTNGDIDAIYSPRAPDAFLEGRPEVGRLFEDPRSEEERYFASTGIFPIMHVLVVRREVYEANRWLARSLTKAFTRAKDLAMEELSRTAALSVSLPWAQEELRSAMALMGADFWPYGIAQNRPCLSTFARYSYEQGLARRRFEPEELFAPESVDEILI